MKSNKADMRQTRASRVQHPKKPSRQRILEAGRNVFTACPYGAASVRKIEQAGGFNYALLRYYFGSKKGLFDAVAADLAGQYRFFLPSLLERALAQSHPEQGLALLVDELVDFGLAHPEGPSLVMQNIGESRHLDTTALSPAAMRRVLDGLQNDLRNSRWPAISDRELAGAVFAFVVLTANFIGAGSFHAASLGLSADPGRYGQWVKEALLTVFEPFIKASLAPDWKKNQVKKHDLEITIPANSARRMERAASGRTALGKKETKGDRTRTKILDAAQAVFTKKDYHTASIRMIGRQGGFDFTIIHHYFPTKRELAEAVTHRIFADFFRTSSDWWQDFAAENADLTLRLRPAMSQYFKRLLNYYFAHPSAPALLMQNIAQSGEQEPLPGLDQSLLFFNGILDRLKSFLPVTASEESIRKWQYCLTTLITNCVGAPRYPAGMVDLAPDSTAYRQWILMVILETFYPGLRLMLSD
ncbi:MAG: TetR/AcrR family transcriptional regulator [Desulfosudaceae bacterium]